MATSALGQPAVLDGIFRYLSRADLLHCCLVNRRWHHHTLPYIYGNIWFGSYWTSPWDAWCMFLSMLPYYSLSIRHLVYTIDLTDLTAPLYHTVPDHWLQIVLEQLPALRTLVLSRCTLVHSGTWSTLTRPKPRCYSELTKLALDGVDDISDKVIAQLPALFPSLRSLTLINTRGVTDRSLGQILEQCRELRVLRIGYTHRVGDDAWLTLGQRGITSPLTSVRLLDLNQLTNHGLRYVANRCPQLQRVVIRGCSRVTMTGLVRTLADVGDLGHRSWRTLDISQCKSLQADALTWAALARYLRSLETLRVSYAVAIGRHSGQFSGAGLDSNTVARLAHLDNPWPCLARLQIDEIPSASMDVTGLMDFLRWFHYLEYVELVQEGHTGSDPGSGSNFRYENQLPFDLTCQSTLGPLQAAVEELRRCSVGWRPLRCVINGIPVT
ncbi:hypothetical protein IWQ61_002504 [Dispira simplex]|nr:hypothetical protein IWQ61_002504 [Dispira simplex]